MEGEDYIYVNGEGSYKGNLLLEPDGPVTRAELYNVIAELGHPVELTMPEAITDCICISTAALVVCAATAAIKAFRK